mgnify:CR=1 FL=1
MLAYAKRIVQNRVIVPMYKLLNWIVIGISFLIKIITKKADMISVKPNAIAAPLIPLSWIPWNWMLEGIRMIDNKTVIGNLTMESIIEISGFPIDEKIDPMGINDA